MIDLSRVDMKKLVHTEVVKERRSIWHDPLCLLLVVTNPLKWMGTIRIMRSTSGSLQEPAPPGCIARSDRFGLLGGFNIQQSV